MCRHDKLKFLSFDTFVYDRNRIIHCLLFFLTNESKIKSYISQFFSKATAYNFERHMCRYLYELGPLHISSEF
jgi:hypothetical protein